MWQSTTSWKDLNVSCLCQNQASSDPSRLQSNQTRLLKVLKQQKLELEIAEQDLSQTSINPRSNSLHSTTQKLIAICHPIIANARASAVQQQFSIHFPYRPHFVLAIFRSPGTADDFII
jgi:hypothetical protein